MPLSGSAIVKMLPNRKGCRECGFPTCFAFAMKLVSGGTTVDKCPYLSPETKAEIEEALAPPITLVTIGSGENILQIGNEEVIYRHENTFVHAPGIGLLVSDKESEAKVEEKIKKINELKFTWLGLTLKAELLALHFESGDRSKFEALVRKVCQTTDLGIILMSEDTDVLFSARDMCAGRHPLLYPITKENIEEAIPRIKAMPTPVGVRGGSVEELVLLTSKLKDAGIKEVVLDPGSKNVLEAVRDQTFIRRTALKHNFRPLGYPTIAFPCFMTKDGLKEILIAGLFIIKYAGIIVLSDLDRYSLFPLLVQRFNIYTNPKLPPQIEENIYEIGNPNENSPVLLSSNWALTYLTLSSAIESAKIPAFLCVKSVGPEPDTLCWCPSCYQSSTPGTLKIDEVGQLIKRCGIEDRVKHRKLVISLRSSKYKGGIEGVLPEWEIIVGPNDIKGIRRFLPQFAKELSRC